MPSTFLGASEALFNFCSFNWRPIGLRSHNAAQSVGTKVSIKMGVSAVTSAQLYQNQHEITALYINPDYTANC